MALRATIEVICTRLCLVRDACVYPKASPRTQRISKNIDKISVVIKRNVPYEQGMYGVSIHTEPGGAANITPISSEENLREQLLAFGLTESYAAGIIDRLKERHESVKIEVDKPRAGLASEVKATPPLK